MKNVAIVISEEKKGFVLTGKGKMMTGLRMCSNNSCSNMFYSSDNTCIVLCNSCLREVKMITNTRTFERNEIREILLDYLRIDTSCGASKWVWDSDGALVVKWVESPVARCDVCKCPLAGDDTVELWKWVMHKECEGVVHDRVMCLWEWLVSDEFCECKEKCIFCGEEITSGTCDGAPYCG